MIEYFHHNGVFPAAAILSPMKFKQVAPYLTKDDEILIVIKGLTDFKLSEVYQLFKDLTTTLKTVNAERILVRANGTYAVDVDSLDCDYFSYLKCGKPEFRGEYMSQYSWAEVTLASLLQK